MVKMNISFVIQLYTYEETNNRAFRRFLEGLNISQAERKIIIRGKVEAKRRNSMQWPRLKEESDGKIKESREYEGRSEIR